MTAKKEMLKRKEESLSSINKLHSAGKPKTFRITVEGDDS